MNGSWRESLRALAWISMTVCGAWDSAPNTYWGSAVAARKGVCDGARGGEASRGPEMHSFPHAVLAPRVRALLDVEASYLGDRGRGRVAIGLRLGVKEREAVSNHEASLTG